MDTHPPHPPSCPTMRIYSISLDRLKFLCKILKYDVLFHKSAAAFLMVFQSNLVFWCRKGDVHVYLIGSTELFYGL